MRRFYVLALSIPLLLVGCVDGGSIPSLPITLSLPTTAQIVDGGGTLSFQVDISNDFGADGVKWTLTGPGTLTYPQSTLVSSPKYQTVYNAPTNVAFTTSATVTATSVADPTKSAAATITVYPTVVLPALPMGLAPKVGVAFSNTLPGSGGSGPLTYAVISGALPPGLLLSASGALSGTATAVGAYTVTIQAQDKPLSGTVLGSASQTYTFTVS